MRRSPLRSRLLPWVAALVLLALSLRTGAQPDVELPDKTRKAPAAVPPDHEARQLISMGAYNRAIAICRAHIHPDSSNVTMRSILARAYAERDRICVPSPPTAQAFRKLEESALKRCGVEFLPAATRDTVAAIFREEEAIAPDAIDSYSLSITHEFEYGSPEDLRRALAHLDRFDPALVQSQLFMRLSGARRPGQIAVLTESLLDIDLPLEQCLSYQHVLNSLLVAGKTDEAIEFIGRIPSEDQCDLQLLPMSSMVLAVAGRYRELWELTRALPAEIGAIAYYRYALTSALAAAHFDTARARKRLEHERDNEEAYPEPARELLWKIHAMVADPGTTGSDWAELADGEEFLTDLRFRDIRFLARTLALKLNPRLIDVVEELASDLIGRQLWLQAAAIYEKAAGGREAGLEARWDPRRPDLLRKAAANYLLGEDHASCLAVLAAIDDLTLDDRFMIGVAALRSGDRAAARAALEKVLNEATVEPMADTATRLLALVGEESP